MSVSREVIAEIHCVPVEMVRCKYCEGYSKKYCETWDTDTGKENFCSFWRKKDGPDKAN